MGAHIGQRQLDGWRACQTNIRKAMNEAIAKAEKFIERRAMMAKVKQDAKQEPMIGEGI